MGRYKKKGLRANWTPAMMEEALTLIAEGKSQRFVEDETGIPRRTIRNHMISKSKSRKLGRKCVLTPEQEDDLIKRLVRLYELGVPQTAIALRRNVFKYVELMNIPHPFKHGLAGKDWYQAFKIRHPEISVRKAQSLNQARAQKLNPIIVRDHFEALENTMIELGVKNEALKIFNMDEKGCRLCLHHTQKVLAPTGSKRVHMVANEHGENVTIAACVSAAGFALPPMIIMKGKKVRPEWVDNLPRTCRVEASDKGSMTQPLFIKFLEHVSRCKPKGNILLIFDGAKCHIDIDIVQRGLDLGIHLYCLPANTTHELQPLDRSVFRSFEHFWDEELLKYWDRFPDRVLNKSRFGFIFTPVWQKCMTPSNIESGFRVTGKCSFSPSLLPPRSNSSFTLILWFVCRNLSIRQRHPPTRGLRSKLHNIQAGSCHIYTHSTNSATNLCCSGTVDISRDSGTVDTSRDSSTDNISKQFCTLSTSRCDSVNFGE